jgi:DNA polymerase-3 subunit epsilon
MQRSFDDLGTPLCDVTFCVLDLETTGSDRLGDMITEVGAVKVRGGEWLGQLQTLVNPGKAIPPTITVLTGISEAMVCAAPRVETVLPTLLEFLGDSVLVGHNVAFDAAFLNAALARSGRERLPNRIIDTLALARRLVRDEVPDCRLHTLASRFRLDHRPSHRALDDALATTDLLHLLLERAAGHGVLGLDDLIALPRLGSHPQAAKLRMTTALPRTPGVYLFHGAGDGVLYVGKATNLRQRVRSYFGSDDRRKIGPLLRETQRISCIATPDVLSAEVLELRYIHHHLPRYNRVGTTAERYCYVRLSTEEAWPRLSIVKRAGTGGVHLGPLPSKGMAALVVEALQTVYPLRRCTARLGGRHQPDTSRAPCIAAQLGVASCPCAEQVDAVRYAALAARAAGALGGDADEVLDVLYARMRALAGERRFEEAAAVRDRAQAFLTAVRRQQALDGLRRAGRVELQIGELLVTLDRGVLSEVREQGALPWPLPLPAPDVGPPDRPVDAACVDEMLCLARGLERLGARVRVHSSEGDWLPAIPAARLARLDAA